MRLNRALLSAAVAATLAAAVTAPAQAVGRDRPSTQVAQTKQTHGVSAAAVARAASYPPSGSYTATWKYADALKVRPDVTNTTPVIPADFPVMTDQVWVWDTWPLTDIKTRPLTYKGWKVIFSLVAPRNIFFGDRHWQARIGFFY